MGPRHGITRGAVGLGLLLACAGAAAAGNWPGWRGPTGMGQTDEKELPLNWGGPKAENVIWKAPLFADFDKVRLDQNQSSPIVWGERVVVTASHWPAGVGTERHPEHHVLCFRRGDGRQLWDTKVPPGPWLLKGLRGGYTAPTPASDGERVYVLFGSAVLAALDLDGRLLWRKPIVPHQFDVAVGTSPVLYRGKVLLQCDQVNRQSRLLAFDGRSGELAWEKRRPDTGFSHSTPVVATDRGQVQLLVAASGAVQGVNPANGDVIWWCAAHGDTASPVLGGPGLVYCDSGRGGPGVAVDPT